MTEVNKIYCGNTIDVLKTFPDNFIQCCVTSPPYYGLRDYGIGGQIGLEKSPEEYIQSLVEVFREVNRVLRDDGTFWLNLGDSYNGSGGPGSQYDTKASRGYKGEFKKFENPNKNIEGLKPKDLIGIPWAMAFALRADGWYLRSDIIWSKNNPMPESVKDRPTKSHEYIFLLSKNKKYFYDYKAIKEPNSDPNRTNYQCGNRSFGINSDRNDNDMGIRSKDFKPDGRNARSVWSINTKPYREAHFATFPIELPERCIKAGSKEGDIILDPFNGAGTTCLVAKKLNRQYIGIDLNPNYCKLAEERIEKE
jgi:DNA modification methylase